MEYSEGQNFEFTLMRILFRPEAEDELVEAIDWYDLQSPGLGADLLRCVDACAFSVLFASQHRIPSSTVGPGWLLFTVFLTWFSTGSLIRGLR